MRVVYLAGWLLFGAAIAGGTGAGVVLEHEHRERSRATSDPTPALSYGQDGATYFKLHRNDPKPEAPLTLPAAGSDLWICWDGIVWKRPLELRLKVWFIDSEGRLDDYDDPITVHFIHPAPEMGPYPKKCRSWKLPGGLAPGEHTMTGVATPVDPESKSRPVPFPKIRFVVK